MLPAVAAESGVSGDETEGVDGGETGVVGVDKRGGSTGVPGVPRKALQRPANSAGLPGGDHRLNNPPKTGAPDIPDEGEVALR